MSFHSKLSRYDLIFLFSFSQVLILKLLRSIGYEISPRVWMKMSDFEFVGAMCLNMIEYNKMDSEDRARLENGVSTHLVNVCEQTLPLMSNVRKRKMKTLLLCINRVLNGKKLGKDLTIMILDYTYSPSKMKSSV